MLWVEHDRRRIKEMLETYQTGKVDHFMQNFAEKLSDDVNSFDRKVVG